MDERDYVAKRPCGCVCYWAAYINSTDDPKGLAKEIAKCIRGGLSVERMTTEEARASTWRCEVCSPEKLRRKAVAVKQEALAL